MKNDGIKKILYGMIGAVGGSAVVVAIAAQQLILNTFDIDVVKDKVYYALELEEIRDPEDTSPPADYQIRLVTSSQYGEYYVDLDLGYNEGVVEDLYLNTSYKIWVEYDNGMVWTKLDEKAFQTDQMSEVYLKDIYEVGDIRKTLREIKIELSSYVRDEDIGLITLSSPDISDFHEMITDGDQTIEIPEVNYQQTLTFNVIKNDEIIKSFTYEMIAPLDGHINIELSNQYVTIDHTFNLDERFIYFVDYIVGDQITTVLLSDFQTMDLSQTTITSLDIYVSDGTHQYILYTLDLSLFNDLNYVYTNYNLLHTITIIENIEDIDLVLLNDQEMTFVSYDQNQYTFELILDETLTQITIIFNGDDVITYQINFEGETNNG